MIGPLTYIAGPYAATADATVSQNIDRARRAAVDLANRGIPFFCPHLNTADFGIYAPDVPESFYLELDLRILAFCDAILMLPGWENSAGAKREIEEAWHLGLGIYFYGIDDLDAIKPLDKVVAAV